MAKRKYTRHGDKPVAFECTNRKCKWQGTDDEKETVRSLKHVGFWELACPKCGNEEFYGLLEMPKNDSN